MRGWLRRWVKRRFWLYDIDDLQIGGHCGLCGRWVPDCIVEKGPRFWAVTICRRCLEAEEGR